MGSKGLEPLNNSLPQNSLSVSFLYSLYRVSFSVCNKKLSTKFLIFADSVLRLNFSISKNCCFLETVQRFVYSIRFNVALTLYRLLRCYTSKYNTPLTTTTLSASTTTVGFCFFLFGFSIFPKYSGNCYILTH